MIKHLEIEIPANVDLQRATDAFVVLVGLENVHLRPEPPKDPNIIRGFLAGNPTTYVSNSEFMAPDLISGMVADGRVFFDIHNNQINIPEQLEELLKQVVRPTTWRETALNLFNLFGREFVASQREDNTFKRWFPKI